MQEINPEVPESRLEISVVVCTHNRATLLQKALESVVAQDVGNIAFELLVVDNASTDETREVVHGFSDRANVQYIVRYIYEAELGLCVARNTGWKSAAGKYIAYFDDDAIASPGWLAAVADGFARNPNVGVIGGPAFPIWEAEPPKWLSVDLAKLQSIIDLGRSERLIEDLDQEWFIGANLAIPKKLLAQIGGFHPGLDRVGGKLLSNGDLYLQMEVMREGYGCLYMPSMAIGHLVSASRLTRRWFLRRYFWQGISDAAMLTVAETVPPAARVKVVLKGIAGLFIPPAKFVYRALSARQPKCFMSLCWLLSRAGFVYGMLGAAKR